jgi:aryl-alcohol dehydrogenase-like predicted oxidoreductase
MGIIPAKIEKMKGEDDMQQRKLGKTDLTCSAIGFGTWEMSTTMYGDIDVNEASIAVNKAIDCGITLFDTAEVYGPFHSEELLAKALGERRKEVTLVTKVGFNYDDNGKITGVNSKPDNLIKRTEGCLKRLQTEVIDLMLVHWWDNVTPVEEIVDAFETLKKSGKIRYYGVSNFNVEMTKKCQNQGNIAANQVGYNMFDRRMEKEVLPYCLENDIGFMAYGTLAYGLLTGTFTPETTFPRNDWRSSKVSMGLPLFQREHFLKELQVGKRLAELAKKYGKSLAQLAIAWVLGHPAVSVALVGMRNEKEMNENIAGVEWELISGDRSEIDRIFQEEGVSTYIDEPQILRVF